MDKKEESEKESVNDVLGGEKLKPGYEKTKQQGNEVIDIFHEFSNMFKYALNSKMSEFENDPNSEIGAKIVNLFTDLIDKTVDTGNEFINTNFTECSDLYDVIKSDDINSKTWKDKYITNSCSGGINTTKLTNLRSSFMGLNILEKQAFLHSIKRQIKSLEQSSDTQNNDAQNNTINSTANNIKNNTQNNNEVEDLKVEIEILKHKIATLSK